MRATEPRQAGFTLLEVLVTGFVFSILVAFMLFRSQGLLGRPDIRKV